MTPTTTYRVRQDLAYRQVAEVMVIMDPQGGILHTLNEVGCFVWQRLEQQSDSVEGLVHAVTVEFEVDQQQARADLDSFLAEMTAKDLLQASTSTDD